LLATKGVWLFVATTKTIVAAAAVRVIRAIRMR
jgi:hypothetical protein